MVLVLLIFLIEVKLARMQNLHYPSEEYHQVFFSGVPKDTILRSITRYPPEEYQDTS